MRPADGNETAGAYKHFGQKDVRRMSMSKHVRAISFLAFCFEQDMDSGLDSDI